MLILLVAPNSWHQWQQAEHKPTKTPHATTNNVAKFGVN